MTAARKFTSQNVRNISPWKNNCLAATMADFVTAGLMSDVDISDETAMILGEMVGNYYHTDSLTRQQLKALFTAVSVPVDLQVLLGVVFRKYIEDMCEADKVANAGVIDHTQQVTPKGFQILAQKLKVNVDYYVSSGLEISSVAEALVKTPGLSSQPAYKELAPICGHASGALYVLCKSNHYDRLIVDAAKADSLNRKDMLLVATPIVDSRDNLLQLKQVVKTQIEQILGVKKQARAAVPAAKAVSTQSIADKFASFQKGDTTQNVKSVSQMTEEFAALAPETEEKKFKELVADTKSVNAKDAFHAVEYTLNSGRVYVTKADQINLDAQLARKLQQEEVIQSKKFSK